MRKMGCKRGREKCRKLCCRWRIGRIGLDRISEDQRMREGEGGGGAMWTLETPTRTHARTHKCERHTIAREFVLDSAGFWCCYWFSLSSLSSHIFVFCFYADFSSLYLSGYRYVFPSALPPLAPTIPHPPILLRPPLPRCQIHPSQPRRYLKAFRFWNPKS